MPPPTPHRRFNPLLDEWVLCSPQRLERPWEGQLEKRREEPLPPYDPGCFLCPGNPRASGERNPRYTTTFAFDNDFPALRPGPVSAADSDDLLRARPEAGRCRVLCFSPRHDLTLAQLDEAALRAVVESWIDEVASLAASGEFAHVQVFENKGELMGCSNPHPHCQVWATQHVPSGLVPRPRGLRGRGGRRQSCARCESQRATSARCGPPAAT